MVLPEGRMVVNMGKLDKHNWEYDYVSDFLSGPLW
jgi:hypothetical protein